MLAVINTILTFVYYICRPLILIFLQNTEGDFADAAVSSHPTQRSLPPPKVIHVDSEETVNECPQQ